MAPPDTRSSSIEVQPGYMTQIIITPTQTITSSNAESMDEEDRECRFRNEAQDLDIYKVYSQSACRFECKMKQAFNACHCIPWNYPQFASDLPVCNRFGSYCFKEAMIKAECNCPMDCIFTRYSYSMSAVSLETWKTWKPIMDRSSNLYDFMKGQEDYDNPNPLRRVAIVTFKLATEQVTKIIRSKRVTFSDSLSNIGK